MTSATKHPVTPTSTPHRPEQSLAAAGILAVSVASFHPPSSWLTSYLTRVLSPLSSLPLPDGARAALIHQALEVCTSPATSAHAVQALNGYLSAADFAASSAVPLIASFLHADVVSTTSYDARAREALLRFATALHLPPRVVYTAEAALAALVQSLADNAASSDSANLDAAVEESENSRRRRNAKWLKVGAAGVVGGLALGLSGGLIAPALLPALSGVGLASVSAPLTALGSSGAAAAVGGLFGAAGAGVGAAAMASRTGVVDEFRFEPCVSTISTLTTTVDNAVKLSPRDRLHQAFIPCRRERREGGLLVWEILTSQDHVMVVPGLIGFAVGFRAHSLDNVEWLLPEEHMEVGGYDRDQGGIAKRRRLTGAITVQGAGEYVINFRLMPGSLSVNVSYRVAIVPPGKDPPLWVMGENEQQEQSFAGADIRSLSMAIFVPGLVTTAENGPYPGMCAEQFLSTAAVLEEYDVQCFALRWDTELLMELSDALKKLIGRMAMSMAAQKGAMMVAPALIGVVGAVALPISLIAALRTIIGNIWAKTLSHAEECGYMLAAELASRSFGNRPVVLAGYSAGAVVVFSCLRELARRKLAGIVHDVCVIGAPVTADVKVWREVRGVVAGRLINVYNERDWYLELYHRGTNLGSVAGTRRVEEKGGETFVENVGLGEDVINNHTDYARMCGDILKEVGIGDVERRRPWRELEVLEEAAAGDEKDGDRGASSKPAAQDGVVDADGYDVVLFNANGRRRQKLRRSVG